MSASEDKTKIIEYYFIDMEGNEVKIIPICKIMADTFIFCYKYNTSEALTIYRNRIKWRII